jgi:enoyl-CoA hydratase/carnithine racemase
MSDFETILFDQKNHTAIITLNRPERMNASNGKMREELGEAWKIVKKEPSIRVAIVTAAGDRAFGVGQDLKETSEKGSVQHAYPGSARYHDVWKPVICAVNGMCAGGGLHHVCDSDIVICSDNATFLDTHCAVGSVFALEPITLARRIPLNEVMRMMLMARHDRLTAQRAYEIGLVCEVVPRERLMPRALEMADHIAELSPATVTASLKAVWEGLDMGLKDAIENGWKHIRSHQGNHPDFLEGAKAFTEKREPNWTV